jgi:hypothetical protein
MAFGNPLGLFALLALLPFIFLYLRRPKPKERTIPSLMFFMRSKGSTKFANFFREIIRNLLFLLQLLILLSLIFAATSPFFTTDKPTSSEHTALVIDGSASMNALLADGSGTRFEKAISEALSRMEGRVSIVLATNFPIVVLDKGTTGEARKILATLRAKSTQTHIGDGMLAAGELIEATKTGTVLVLSDFQSNQGTDVIVAKRSLDARGIDVNLVKITGSQEKLESLSNVGFVGVDVNKFSTTGLVRNYDDEQRDVEIEIFNKESSIATEKLTIGPRSLESISFDTMHGETELEILRKDDFETDNRAFVSSPTRKVDVLLITNSDSSYLRSALTSAPNIKLDIATPPVIRSFGYDVIVIQNATQELMLPGFYRDINRAVDNGTGLIITSQDNLDTYFKEFEAPLRVTGLGNSSLTNVRIENFMTSGVEFGVISQYTKIKPDDDGGFTSLVVADDETPLIGFYSKKTGLVMYYGLIDELSSFKTSYFYPIFWDNMLSFLTNTQDLSSFNLLTGSIEVISEQEVSTPNGNVKTDRLLMDDSGFYTFSGKTVASNLLDAKESDIASDESTAIINSDSKLLTSDSKAKSEFSFEIHLVLAALALILIELLIIKTRGDL